MISKLVTAVTKMMTKNTRLRFCSGAPRYCSIMRSAQSVKKYNPTATIVNRTTSTLNLHATFGVSVAMKHQRGARLRRTT